MISLIISAAARQDERLQEMAQILRGKADPEGRFTPESVCRDW
jgi:hypothetical protein